MATEGRTGTADTVDATGELVFDTVEGTAGNPCSTFMVRAVVGDVWVRIGGMHPFETSTGIRIVEGDREYFRYGTNAIRQVFVQSTGASSTIDWGPVAST